MRGPNNLHLRQVGQWSGMFSIQLPISAIFKADTLESSDGMADFMTVCRSVVLMSVFERGAHCVPLPALDGHPDGRHPPL